MRKDKQDQSSRHLVDVGFPDRDSLCEACGYPLRGVGLDQVCPECGRAVGDSDPAHRKGLPWQNAMGVVPWLRTLCLTGLRPNYGFGLLRVDQPSEFQNFSDRMYLGSFAVLIGILWACIWWFAGLGHVWRWSAAAVLVVIVMTYIEVLGVAYFSQSRGWRVSLALAERIGCYSAVGWVPAALFFEGVCILDLYGILARHWPTGWGIWDLKIRLFALTLAWGVSIMGFETLVWLGVRKVKFANWSSVAGRIEGYDCHG